MLEAPCLAMYLDGPMQSWGCSSRFGRRTTLSYPTRSGIIGVLAAASGIDRADADSLSKLDPLGLEVLSFHRERKPVMRWNDYHTVGGGYNAKTQRTSLPRKANNASPGTVLTDREYLADARFGVVVTGDPEQLEQLDAALANPRWGLWLGRKCCIPTHPIGQGRFDSREAAVAHLTQLAQGQLTRCISEASDFDQGSDTLLDRPLNFSTREFTLRRIDDQPTP